MRTANLLAAALLMFAFSAPATEAAAQLTAAGDNLEAEKRAIKELLERQTRLFWVGDYDSYVQVWAHEPHVVRMDPNGQRTVGWSAVSDIYRNWMGATRRPVQDYTLATSDWHIHVNGSAAWAINNQHETGTVEGEPYATDVWNVRFLEKTDGQWKVVLILPSGPTGGTTALTGPQVWDRVIAYHDPSGNWSNFHGKVHIVTTWPNGTWGQEELELRRSENFYQSTQYHGEVRTTKGVRDGECFHALNDNASPTPEEIKQYGLDCESIEMFKEHHTQHFGLPMELKNAGVAVEETVTRTELLGTPVYALNFTGETDTVSHPYYLGAWTIFVDPQTFAMRGIRVKSERFGDSTCSYDGELEVEGVRMPQVKTCRRDGKLFLTDTFAYRREQG